tara:strand:+ start:713 stop:1366 length:654 start_codon:yes stop_codon:yes gene_type:complete
MEVILLESFDKLGKIGDTVSVKDGFARNYLLPKKKALRANDENKKYFEKIKEDLNEKNKKLIENSNDVADLLQKTELIFIRQASDSGQLYGSVSPKDISVHLTEKKISIPPSSINLTSPIKNIGMFDVVIKLHAEVSVKVRLNVATSQENAEKQKKELEDEVSIKNLKNNMNQVSADKDEILDNKNLENKSKNPVTQKNASTGTPEDNESINENNKD